MKNIPLLTLLMLFTLACSPLPSPVEGARREETPVETATQAQVSIEATKTVTVEPTTPPAAESVPVSVPFQPVPDAVYQTNGDVTTVAIPSGSCAAVYSSPIKVGDFIVWANHDGKATGCTASPYKDAVLGYNVTDGKLYLLARSGSSEATLLYQPDVGRVFQNIVFGGTVSALDATTFQRVASLPADFRVTSDASGVYLNGLYYFGTINTPENFCQNPVNANCGGVFAMDANGNIVDRLDKDNGHFRSWIGAGLTSDGQFIYAGGAEHFLGSTEPPGYYGCSVVKLDPQLNILASFDPGDAGCHSTGVGQNDEDAVAGEVVIAGDGSLWVVFTHGVDSRNMFAMYHLDANLQPMCAFEVAGGPLPMTGYYQSPTIDKDGNVYVNIMPSGISSGAGQLWKVTPTCQGTQLASLSQGGASTPVLADDQYILTIAGGQLHIRNLSGNVVKTCSLASQATVAASPMIADGVIYVVDTTGSLTVIRNSGLQGYGTAAWPRYRHDNYGSGLQMIPPKIFLPLIVSEGTTPNQMTQVGDPAVNDASVEFTAETHITVTWQRRL